MKKRIAIPAGYWSTNIGNSFFQLGTENVLQTAFPGHDVFLIGDQPGYWSPGKKENPENAFLLSDYLDIDYIAIQGPFLRPEYDRIWLPTLQKLYARGVKIIFLAAGMMRYDQENIKRYREWLSKTPPYLLTTRDTITFNAIHDLAEHSYDGIDVAFFISDYFKPPKLNWDQFVVFNFDKWPEPRISKSMQNTSGLTYSFEFDGEIWQLTFPQFRTSAIQRSRLFQFFNTWLPEQQQETFGNYPIIRTDHRFNPLGIRNVFRGKNSIAIDIPHPYLTTYANAKLTLSNRVHACVATLAYGNAAMLFSNSPRAALLDRVGLKEVGNKPVKLDMEYLRKEKENLVSFLRSIDL